jgi:hypothetical protein|tara:strand:- start:1558 stop:2124 length:567 start_codon:yes stop_codon:yes gene_type:complete
MHFVEPFFEWRDFYIAAEDSESPFFEREYSEFEFEHKIYNYVIHPQWDDMGSETLFIKILFVEYEENYAIIEMIGEWNDAIENDIMTFKRDIVESLMQSGITKFILIGENVLNFHYSDESYYEEWFDELDDGWVAMVNFHDHVSREFIRINLDQYFVTGGELDDMDWRTMNPYQFFKKVNKLVDKRLT